MGGDKVPGAATLSSTDFGLLRFRRRIIGPVITYVKTDFREDDLLKLFEEHEWANESDEYSVVQCRSKGAPVVLIGTGSGSSNVLTALYESSKMKISALVRIGAVGSLKPEVDSVVLADSAICLLFSSMCVAER